MRTPAKTSIGPSHAKRAKAALLGLTVAATVTGIGFLGAGSALAQTAPAAAVAQHRSSADTTGPDHRESRSAAARERAGSPDLASRDLASRDLASRDLASRDLASRDLVSHDLAS